MMFGRASFTRRTTSRVDALPFLNTVTSEPRTPFCRTMFC